MVDERDSEPRSNRIWHPNFMHHIVAEEQHFEYEREGCVEGCDDDDEKPHRLGICLKIRDQIII